jgi:hypothetical protein
MIHDNLDSINELPEGDAEQLDKELEELGPITEDDWLAIEAMEKECEERRV